MVDNLNSKRYNRTTSDELRRIYNDGFKHGEWRANNGLPLDKTPCEQYDNEIQNGTWDCGEKCGWFYQTCLKLSESNVIDGWTLPKGWTIIASEEPYSNEIVLWFYSRKGTEMGFKRMKFLS